MSTRRTLRRPSLSDVTAPITLYLPVSFVVLGLVTFAALVILMIGARSPYTHANLATGFDPSYVRTPQAVLGEELSLVHADASRMGGDPVARGAALYVSAGCAGCHALAGRGGVVGPRIAGVEAATIAQRVRQGPVGMPRFSATALGEREVSDIAAYLRSLPPN